MATAATAESSEAATVATAESREIAHPQIPLGTYRKEDGVYFTILEGDEFCFRGERQPVRRVGDAEASFTITWEWGEPTFVLQPDGATLVESGEHAFVRQLLPVGEYINQASRSGLRFWIESDDDGGQRFLFEGESQKLRFCPSDSSSSGRAAFTITWTWGNPWFQMQEDLTTLIEDGEHIWKLKSHQLPSIHQLRALRDSGCLLLHHALPPAQVQSALRSYDVRTLVDRAKESPSTWLEGPSSHPAVLDLARPLWPMLTYLFGEPPTPPSSAQIAVKSPGGDACEPGAMPPDAHIDGLHAPGNGVPPGAIHNFTLLLGIYLTDVPAPNMGNFGVFPGSHRALALAIDSKGGAATAASVLGAEDGQSATQHLQSLIPFEELPPPQPLCAMAGAAYLAHYQTIHFVHPNALGTEPRVAVYFRLTAPRQRAWATAEGDDARSRISALTARGLLCELPGLANIFPA